MYRFVVGDRCIYVGSTAQKLASRLAVHKHLSLECQRRVYQLIRDAGGWDAVTVDVLWRSPTCSRKELYESEARFCAEHAPTGNLYRPSGRFCCKNAQSDIQGPGKVSHNELVPSHV